MTSPTPDNFYTTLATKRMGAGVLFTDNADRVLLVKPVYKPGWEVPGGAVEAGESPYTAARREIAEELGLTRDPGALLVLDCGLEPLAASFLHLGCLFTVFRVQGFGAGQDPLPGRPPEGGWN